MYYRNNLVELFYPEEFILIELLKPNKIYCFVNCSIFQTSYKNHSATLKKGGFNEEYRKEG